MNIYNYSYILACVYPLSPWSARESFNKWNSDILIFIYPLSPWSARESFAPKPMNIYNYSYILACEYPLSPWSARESFNKWNSDIRIFIYPVSPWSARESFAPKPARNFGLGVAPISRTQNTAEQRLTGVNGTCEWEVKMGLRVEYVFTYSCGAITRIRIRYSAWLTLYVTGTRTFSRWTYSQNRLHLKRIQYDCPRSAYSCRQMGGVNGPCEWEVTIRDVNGPCEWEVTIRDVNGPCEWEVTIRGVNGPCKKRNRSHTQTHDTNNTTHDHTKDHPPDWTHFECGAATMRTTSHTRVGGRTEVSVEGRVENGRWEPS